MSETPIPGWMKREVLDRDGWTCLSCKRPVHIWPGGKQRDDSLHFDHIIPECKRGMTTVDNLQVLCRRCNLAKGSRIIDYRPKPKQAPPAASPIQIVSANDLHEEAIRAIDERVKAEVAAIRAAPTLGPGSPGYVDNVHRAAAPAHVQAMWDQPLYPGFEKDVWPNSPKMQARARAWVQREGITL